MSLEFRIGGRVVCVDDSWPTYCSRQLLSDHKPIYPVRGVVYTIKEISTDWPGGSVGLLLHELRQSAPRFYRDWFDSRRFRPVRETSIDCFTALLAKPPVRQKENA